MKLSLFLWLVAAYALCLMPGPIYWEQRLQPTASGSYEPTALREDGGLRTEVGGLRSGIRDRGTEDSNQHPASAATDNGRKDIVNAENGSQLNIQHQALDAVLNDHRAAKELGAHFILMFGIAFCLVRSLFSALRPLSSVLCSLVFILLLALSIEFLQELLPEAFHRGFALSDIWVSLAGGLLGALLGSLVKQAGGFRLEARGRLRRGRTF